MTTAAILTINAGSSSLKLSLWHHDGRGELQEALHGKIEKIGIAPRLTARTPAGDTLLDKDFGREGARLTHEALLQEVFGTTSPQPWQLLALLPLPVLVWGSDELWRWRTRHRGLRRR